MSSRSLWVVGGMAGMLALNGAGHAATLNYGFDAATAGGNVVLETAGNNVVNPVGGAFSFDTAIKAEGEASLRMQGETNQNYGNLRSILDIAAFSENGQGQDLAGNNTVLSFKLRTDNLMVDKSTGQMASVTPSVSEVFIDIRIWAGGTASNPTDLAARFWRSDMDDNADGAFLRLEQVITQSDGTRGGGYTGDGDVNLLANAKFISIIYGWSGSTFQDYRMQIDLHMDDLELSGPGVRVVPEPSSLILLGLGALTSWRRWR